jgi:hypothetical protein
MGRKKAGGFVFVTYKGDHPPIHVHIEKNGKDIGRWDIENQRIMEAFEPTRKLRDALRKAGYLV